MAACNEALLINPSCVKALYRRAKCQSNFPNRSLEGLRSAKKDLKFAIKISPNEQACIQELHRLTQQYNRLLKEERLFN